MELENKISKIILKHIQNVNSFIDDEGENHFEPCVKEITEEVGNVAMMLETALGYMDSDSASYKHVKVAQRMLREIGLPDHLLSG